MTRQTILKVLFSLLLAVPAWSQPTSYIPVAGAGIGVRYQGANAVISTAPTSFSISVLSITNAPTAPVMYLTAANVTNLVGSRVSSNMFFTNTAGTGPVITNDPLAGRVFYFPGDGSSLQSASNLCATNSLTVMWLDNNMATGPNPTWYTIGAALYGQRNGGHLQTGAFIGASLPYMQGWIVNTIVYSNGYSWIRANGMTSSEPVSGVAALSIAAQVNVGNFSGLAYNGEVAEFAAWTNCFSPAVLQKMEMGMLQRHGLAPQRQLLLVGDSILYGEEGGYSNLLFNLNQSIGTNVNWLVGDDGCPGYSFSGIGVAAAFDLISNLNPVVIVEGGVNDIQGGNSAATVFASFTNSTKHFWTNGAGKVIYVTPTPFSTTILNVSASEPVRQAYLALIAASGLNYCSAIADWGNDPVMGLTNNLFDTNYYPQESGPDYIHPGAPGYQLLAPHVANAIQAAAKNFSGTY